MFPMLYLLHISCEKAISRDDKIQEIKSRKYTSSCQQTEEIKYFQGKIREFVLDKIFICDVRVLQTNSIEYPMDNFKYESSFNYQLS